MRYLLRAFFAFLFTWPVMADPTRSDAIGAFHRWFLEGSVYPSPEDREVVRNAYKAGDRDADVLFWNGVINQETFGDFLDEATRKSVLVDFKEAGEKGLSLAIAMQISMELERATHTDQQYIASLIVKLNEQVKKKDPLAASFISQIARVGNVAFKRDLSLAAKCAQLSIDLGYVGGYLDLAEVQLAAGDPTEAVKTCRIGAEKGDRRALYTLGCWLRDGRFGETDRQRAQALFAAAGDRNYPDAVLALARLLQENRQPEQVQKAWGFLEEASQVRKSGRYELAISFIYERYGRKRDFRKAKVLLEQLDELDFGPAQKELGIGYLLGIWLPQDPASAKRFLTKAAASGDPDAKNLLRLLEGPNL